MSRSLGWTSVTSAPALARALLLLLLLLLRDLQPAGVAPHLDLPQLRVEVEAHVGVALEEGGQELGAAGDAIGLVAAHTSVARLAVQVTPFVGLDPQLHLALQLPLDRQRLALWSEAAHWELNGILLGWNFPFLLLR